MNTQEIANKLEEVMNLKGVKRFDPCHRWDHLSFVIQWINHREKMRKIFNRKLAITMINDGDEFRLTTYTLSHIIVEVVA